MDLAQDTEGSVAFGWVAPTVYLARFSGNLSASLAAAHHAALEQAVKSVPSLRYFSDCSALTSYDLLARSSFVRVLLSHRKKFHEIVILNWAAGISRVGETLAETVGQPLLVLDDRAAFEHRLTVAAPHHALLVRMSPEAGPRPRSSPQPAPRDRRQ